VGREKKRKMRAMEESATAVAGKKKQKGAREPWSRLLILLERPIVLELRGGRERAKDTCVDFKGGQGVENSEGSVMALRFCSEGKSTGKEQSGKPGR